MESLLPLLRIAFVRRLLPLPLPMARPLIERHISNPFPDKMSANQLDAVTVRVTVTVTVTEVIAFMAAVAAATFLWNY